MEIRETTTISEDTAKHLTELIAGHSGDTICLLAGGSAFSVYEKINLDENTKRRTIFMMGDERVSGEPTLNNYLQLQTNAPTFSQTNELVDTSVRENETSEQFSDRLNSKIKKIISEKNNVQIITVLGMGQDGHTASIFPMNEQSFRETYGADSYYVPVHAEGLKIDSRASITPAFILNHVDQIVGFIAGQSKAEKFLELKNQNRALNEMPAQIFKQHKNAILFTDIQSA